MEYSSGYAKIMAEARAYKRLQHTAYANGMMWEIDDVLKKILETESRAEIEGYVQALRDRIADKISERCF